MVSDYALEKRLVWRKIFEGVEKWRIRSWKPVSSSLLKNREA
jgi:hypothetical protein